MEYLQINSFDDYRVAEIYKSYCETFPEDERRSEQQFRHLFSNPRVKVFSVLKDLKNIGYLISWELTNFVFIEHFEIFSEFRSLKYGSEIISHLYKNYSHIVLEAEPEDQKRHDHGAAADPEEAAEGARGGADRCQSEKVAATGGRV